jgi:hypothetical protein
MKRMCQALGAGVLAGSAMMVGVFAAPVADAHYNCYAHHGDDYGCVYSDHRAVKACDQEADAHGVRMHWKSSSGGNVYIGNWAPSQGCGDSSSSVSVRFYRICEETEGCSDWIEDQHG